MTDFCMYFQTFGMGILAELRFLSFLYFCTEVPMVDRKIKWFIAWSPLHRVQLKQAEHLRKVSMMSRGLAPGEGCKGEALSYQRKFCIWWAEYIQFWGLKRILPSWLKKRISIAKNLCFPPLSFKFRPIYDFGWCKGAVPLCLRKLCIWWAKYTYFQALFSLNL